MPRLCTNKQLAAKKLITAIGVFISFFIFSEYSQAALSEVQIQKIQDLVGQQTYHDGPNCYNAASYISGFTDYLYQTSTMELKYYLAYSCYENKGKPASGDILIIGTPYLNFANSIAHAVVVLENDSVFEKGSPAAFYKTEKFSQDDRKKYLPYTYYSISNIQKSLYAGDISREDRNIKYYSCNGDFKSLNKKCEAGTLYEGIKSIQKQLQAISLNKKRDVSAEARILLDETGRSIEQFHQSDIQDECSLYYFTQWNSILWHFQNSDWGVSEHDAYQKVDQILKSMLPKYLELKIDPASKFILAE
ncbi:hypothetical protein [Bdellovibrio sp. HCB288]|uniref:hypothetical protein n=1 Tax=Bdellovibrio sp. HCB288 TaxID=3394355 RepID=UPI0039B645CA